MEKSCRGVRKGTWTKEEDTLLTRCIEKHGEGKWHQVPLRAGLNRCRKSCRLRWLNYLRPSIKRGCFTEDELDLIVRLHKLLGNKWSLIAGRLPGRTANDVKNFWNTHVEKKLGLGQQTRSSSHIRSIDVKKPNTPTPSSNIIRPRPRTFTNLLHATRKTNEPNDDNKQKQCQDEGSGSSSHERADDWVEWWNKLLELTESGELVKGPLEDTLMGEASSSRFGGGPSMFSFEEFDWGLLNIDEEL